MMKQKRTFLHKGKLRTKRRLPRKLKKKKYKMFDIKHKKYVSSLISIYGDDWDKHIILGG